MHRFYETAYTSFARPKNMHKKKASLISDAFLTTYTQITKVWCYEYLYLLVFTK